MQRRMWINVCLWNGKTKLFQPSQVKIKFGDQTFFLPITRKVGPTCTKPDPYSSHLNDKFTQFSSKCCLFLFGIFDLYDEIAKNVVTGVLLLFLTLKYK